MDTLNIELILLLLLLDLFMVDQIVCLDNGYLSVITTTVHVLPLDKIVVSKFDVGVKQRLHSPSRCWELWTAAIRADFRPSQQNICFKPTNFLKNIYT